jgi:uncharacterized OsmC-like protein
MPGVPMNAAISGLTCKLTHGPSGTSIRTVPPEDNGGDGSSLSPTDLVGAALAACALSTMALVAGREALSWGDARASVEKRMTPPPRRIGELVLVIDMPRETRPEPRDADADARADEDEERAHGPGAAAREAGPA